MNLWPFKILVKLTLAAVPARHKILRKIGIFKHGCMDDVSYAHKIFTQHEKAAFKEKMPEGLCVLELGPGDSVTSALMASARNVSKIYLSDAGSYATQDVDFYKHTAEKLKTDYGLTPQDISTVDNFDDMLKLLKAKYLTNGVVGLVGIPDNSVDYIWSHSVLEHVRKADFKVTMGHLARILKPGGMISHNVDLMDHLNHGLNNLRFPESIWENDYFAGAGFYTNRMGYSESLKIMTAAGLTLLETETGRWPTLPIKRSSLNRAFKDIPEDELRVRTYRVLLTK